MNQEDILKMAREAGVTFKQMTIEGVEYEYRYVECNDDIGGDEAGCIERFAALVAAKAAQDERQKHQADIERWKGEAAKAEKWRGMAMSHDPSPRIVQEVQLEAATAERESIASHYAQQPHVEFFGAELADEIRARGQ